MLTASIPNEDDPLLYAVARPPIGDTAVDGMLIVETAAGRIQLDKLITHLCCSLGGRTGREEMVYQQFKP